MNLQSEILAIEKEFQDWEHRTPYVLEGFDGKPLIEIEVAKSFYRLHITKLIEETLKEIQQELAVLHHHSDSRSAELECSEDGYTYGLEDASDLVARKNRLLGK